METESKEMAAPAATGSNAPDAVLQALSRVPPMRFVPRAGEFFNQTPTATGPYGTTPWNPAPAQPTSGRQLQKFYYTRLNPNVKELHDIMVSGPFWTPWQFHGVNDYSLSPWAKQVDQMVVEALLVNFTGLQGEAMINVLKNMYDNARTYGTSVVEVNWHREDVHGFHWMKSLKTHYPYLFDIYMDATGELQSIYYSQTGQRVKGSWLEKVIINPYPYLGQSNWYGESALIAIKPDVDEIIAYEAALAEGASLLAVKGMIHNYMSQSMDDEQLAETKTQLSMLHSGGIASFPATERTDNGDLAPQHTVAVLEDRASAEGLRIIHERLAVLYKRVARNLGLPDDMGFTDTSVGSNAKAQEESNILTLLFEDGQEWVEGVVNNHLIPLFMRYNFPDLQGIAAYKPPEFRFGLMDEESSETMLYPMLAAYNANAISRTELRHAIGITTAIDEADTVAVITARITAATAPAEPGATPPQQPAQESSASMQAQQHVAAQLARIRSQPSRYQTVYKRRRFHLHRNLPHSA